MGGGEGEKWMVFSPLLLPGKKRGIQVARDMMHSFSYTVS